MSAKKNTKTAKAPKAKSAAKKPTKAKGDAKRTSALDAAAKVLADTGEPMNTKQMIEAMAKKGLWSSPNGKTPDRTLYSALLREINEKGPDARFKKTERGKFVVKK
jgi:HB1, ASXL, restriction endonuclease HTH domain